MIVYISGCLLSIFFTNMALRIKHKKEGWNYWLAMTFFSSLPLMLIAAIRYNVGQDYSAYVRLFRQASTGYRQLGLEIPYYELNRLIAHFGGDETWVFIICALLFSLFTYRHIFSESPYPKLSVYLLVTTNYYFLFLNGMRQMLGCAILLYSIKFIRERRFRPFLVLVLFASCFHYTCILFMIAYFIYNVDINRTAIVVATLVIFALSSLFADAINQIVALTPYIGSAFDTVERGYVGLAINIVIVSLATMYYDPSDRNYRFYYNITVISLWLSAFIGKVVLIDRIKWMFGFSVITMIPLSISKIQDKRTRFIAISAVIVFYAIYFYYTVGINNSSKVLPYQTIFSR